MKPLDIKRIDDACAMYNDGNINNLELSFALTEAGIPQSLVELIGTMHCDNVRMIRELKNYSKGVNAKKELGQYQPPTREPKRITCTLCNGRDSDCDMCHGRGYVFV